MRTISVSRRNFLKGAAATAATVMVLPREVWGANEKLNVGAVGCGGKGDSDTNDIKGCGANLVALCDTDTNSLENKAKGNPNAKKYRDFRKMLDEMDKEIDAVTVSTADHTHFPAAMCAVMHGKHVFVQKPMCHNVWEARRLAEAVREKKLASQMGIQGHANEAARLLCEWIWAGVIGQVKEVHYFTNRPVWPQGQGRPSKVESVPGNLDWNLWLSVAPDRPYSRAYCPFAWRGWWDYGAGALGDIGCHVMDAAFWALDLRNPTSIQAETSGFNPESFPRWSIITYEFPARGKLGPCKVVWHDGGKAPPRPPELESDRKPPNETYAYVIGDKGTIMHDFYCGTARIIPEAKHKDSGVSKIPKSLPRSQGGHMREFVDACKGVRPAGANFEYAASLTEMVVLGNLALRTKEKVLWDGKAMKVTNLPELNKFLRREPRKGYEQFYKGADAPPQPPIKLGPPEEAKDEKKDAKAEAKK
jgi:predicted dehydrogenase